MTVNKVDAPILGLTGFFGLCVANGLKSKDVRIMGLKMWDKLLAKLPSQKSLENDHNRDKDNNDNDESD